MRRQSEYLPEIPETATEEYLEKLTEKILKQLEKATNKNVRLRLNSLLQEAQRRKKKLIQEATPTPTPHKDSLQTEKQDPLKILDTANLSRDEQQQVKEQLKYVLEDIQKQRPESQQIIFPLPVPDAEEHADISPQALLSTIELTKQEYHIVKERMKEMLAKVREQRQGQILGENIPEEEEEEEILLEEEIIPEEESSQADFLLEGEVISEEDLDEEDVILLEDEVIQSEEALEDVSENEFEEPFSFETICRKVKVGEPLLLFSKTTLTEREQAMLGAFEGYIKQTKGLKRQQVFDIQHLTSRSIRELDQLFKTYHLQGYLNVELHNIYNRLLNLRSRISILLS